MDEYIEVNLTIAEGETRQMSVKASDPIRILESEAPSEQKIQFIHNGLPLISSFSFSFYNIRNDDQIVMILHKKKQKAVKKFGISPDLAFDIKSAMGFLPSSNLNLVLESSRLKDQLFMKVEGNYVFHNYLMSKFKEKEESDDSEEETASPTVFKWDNLEKPSTEGLPSVWSNEPN